MKILITEDDKGLREALVALLEADGHEVMQARDCATALGGVGPDTDLLLTDLRLPDGTGLDLIAKARTKQPLLNILVMTGFGSIATAVEAVKLGARGYLTKPLDEEEFERHIKTVDEIQKLRRQARTGGRGDLVGTSRAMQEVYDAIDVAAASDAPVLITGETGTGKELSATAIHRLSARSGGPFVPVNMGAIPSDLVESELFGHERGAFTGAQGRKVGRFTMADGGTLFLDELDSLPVAFQAKLLRVIEDRQIWPLGANTPSLSDFRIIAATGRDPEELRDAGVLRQDLFFRLAVIRIHLPPLAKHAEDIPVMARKILDDLCRSDGGRRGLEGRRIELTPAALGELITQSFPGNVRELRNVLERAASRLVASRTERMVIDDQLLGLSDKAIPALPFKEARSKVADDWARKTVIAALGASDGNVAAAARSLKMNTAALFGLIKKYGLRRMRK